MKNGTYIIWISFIKACTLPNIPTTISLQRAIKKSQEYLLKRYSKIKPELLNIPGPNGLTPLATAVTLGDRDLIEIILNSNPNINFGCPIIGRTPLHVNMYFLYILEIFRLNINNNNYIPFFMFSNNKFCKAKF